MRMNDVGNQIFCNPNILILYDSCVTIFLFGKIYLFPVCTIEGGSIFTVGLQTAQYLPAVILTVMNIVADTLILYMDIRY